MSEKSHEDILRRVMCEVTEKLTGDLREVLAVTLERQISTALSKALLESEFYRRISDDMRGGLKKIYKEISTVAKDGPHSAAPATPDRTRANKLFNEASEQLSAVLTQTEKATVEIMEVVERHLDSQEENIALLQQLAAQGADPAALEKLRASNDALGDDLNNIMLSLSFQDLTGQRIKRAVAALKEIEATVVELYLSSGLLIQAYAETPDRTLEEIEAETRQKVTGLGQSVLDSDLKGPATGASQSQIDDLLAQLGMGNE